MLGMPVLNENHATLHLRSIPFASFAAQGGMPHVVANSDAGVLPSQPQTGKRMRVGECELAAGFETRRLTPSASGSSSAVFVCSAKWVRPVILLAVRAWRAI
jgi:hypothetical protein